MSKVFRRPMFRKGGNVGDGIMTGIVDREQYQVGTPDPFVSETDQYSFNTPYQGRTIPSLSDLTAESTEALLKAAGDRGGYDPLTSFLLAYGPAAAVENRGGGTIANLIAAGEKPIQNLLKEKAEEDRFQRNIKLKATGSAIEKRNRMMETEEDRKYRSGETLKDRLFKKAETKADREFRTDLFNQETDRLLNLQKNDFTNEAKILGLKQDFTGNEAEKERDLKLNMQKIDNALRSDLLNKEQRNKLEILQKQYENSLGILQAEIAGESGIDTIINKGAQKLVDDDIVGSYAEGKNQLTWKYKTSGDLMKKGYNVADEFLNETDDLTKKAKKLYKKGINEGRVYYAPKTNQYYVLEKGEGRGVFVPFNLPGTENVTEEKIDDADNVVEEVDGITNYEYGTAEARDQKRDIRQKIAQMTGPANNPTLNQYGERLIDTRMTPDQKSAYERYLSEYRNR
jgi:hypothetical protein